MISRYNFTDRQSIPRDKVKIEWVENKTGFLSFVCNITPELPRPLNPNARVFVEAIEAPLVMRFDFGTVQNIVPPDSTELIEFPPGTKPQIRIKIVEDGDMQRIVANIDNVNPETKEEKTFGYKSILPAEVVDLGNKIWDLKIVDNSFCLQLNSRIQEPRSITSIAKEPEFISLVYPQIVKTVLLHLLAGPDKDTVDENHDWLVFGAQLAGSTPPAKDDLDDDEYRVAVEEWIESAVVAFCEENSTFDLFNNVQKEREISNG